jgi:lipopolysaccharide export system protein LptA
MKPFVLALAALIVPALSAAAIAQQPPARSGSAPAAAPAAATAAPAKPAKPRGGAPGSPFGGMGGDSKEPIKIDANKLDVLDKDNKAVFSGNVVAVQGETTVRCSVMTVFYEGRGQGGARPSQPSPQLRGRAMTVRSSASNAPARSPSSQRPRPRLRTTPSSTAPTIR